MVASVDPNMQFGDGFPGDLMDFPLGKTDTRADAFVEFMRKLGLTVTSAWQVNCMPGAIHTTYAPPGGAKR